MRKSAPASKRRLRGARLLWTTGLAGSLFGGAGHALAQSFPGFGTVDSTAVSAIVGDTAPTISSTATDLSVTLNAKSTVINWQDFNIPVATTADFNSSRTDQITVLNRVIGNGGPPTLSQIDGILTASNTGLNNIALFLVNPSGIMFGADGSYSGGSFVLSTLDIAPTDFNDLDTNYRAFGGATGALSLLNGAGGINVTDGSFVAIGEAVSIDKSVIATGGDVALVAASDIDFSLQASSPISIKVNAGTALGTATIGSNGQLTGNSVMFAGASTAVASLLNVDAGASLTATDVNGRVIISAGKGSDVAANFPTQASVSYDAGLTASTDNATFAGVVSGQEFVAKTSGDFIATSALAVTGDLTVMAGGVTSLSDSVSAGADLTIIGNSVLLGDGAGTDLYQVGGDVSVSAGAGGIQVASSWQLGTVPLIGTVAFDGGVTAAQDFIINTTNAASVSGNVVAARDYSVTGGTVLLGNMATAVSQTSGGYLSISATAGGVTANAPTGAGITLNSDMDITGAETLSINATGGAINLGAASTLIGGSVAGARANVAAIAVGGATSVGAVYADQFQTGSMGDFTAGGTIDTLQSLAISTTGAISVKGINVGNAGASVSVISTGIGKDVTVDGAITGPNVGGFSGASDVIVQAGTTATGGKATITGNVGSRGGLQADGVTVELGNAGAPVQFATGVVSISAGSGGVTGLGALTLQSDADGTAVPGSMTDRLQIVSDGPVSLGVASRLIGGAVPSGVADQRQALVMVDAPTASVSIGQVDAFGLHIESTAGTASITGSVSLLGNLDVAGATINLGDDVGLDLFTIGGDVSVAAGLGGTQIAANWSLATVPGALSFDGAVTSESAFSLEAIGAVSVDAVTANAGSVALRSDGSFVTASGALLATADISVFAATSAEVQSDVSAGGDYTVSGAGISLGSAGTSTQVAKGAITLTGGGIGGLGVLTLQSDSDGSAVPGSLTDRLQIDATGTVNLGATSRVIAGATPTGLADQRQARVIVNAPTSSVALGQVDAFGLQIEATAGIVNLFEPVSLLGDLQISGATVNFGDTGGLDRFTVGSNVSVTSGAGGTNLASNWSLTPVGGAINFAGSVTSASGLALQAGGAVMVDAITANTGGISLQSDTAGVTATGALLAPADISIVAGATAAVQANVLAGGKYSVSGQAISLGNAGASNQSAAGELSLIAGAGGLNGLGTLTLQSDSDGSAVPGSMTDRLQIDSGGTVSLTPASRLIGGITPVGLTDQRQSRVVVNAPTASVALGQVDAFSLHLDASAGIANLFAPVSVLGDLTVSGATVNLGDNAGTDLFTIGSGISVSAGAGGIHIASNWALAASPLTGPATFDGTVTSDTSFIINTSGPISVDDVITNGAGLDISLVSTASTVSVGSLTTSRSVLVDAADVATVTGNVNVSENMGGYTVNGDSVILGTIGQNVSQAAAGAISITARNNSADGSVLGLGTVGLEANTDGTGTEGLTLTSINGGVALGPLSSLRASRAVGNGSAVTVSGASGKPISFGSASADIVQLLASGNVTAGGAVESNQAFALATPGVIDVRGVKVSDPLAGISLTSTGAGVMTAGSLEAPSDIVVSASSAAQILGGVSAGGNYLASGNSVILSGGAQNANGSVSITAGAGGVSSSGSLALTANADSTPTLGESLDIISAGDVNLTSASLFGGTARQSNVTITATAANAVSFNSANANALLVSAPTATIASAGTIRTTDALSLITSQAISLGTVETTGAAAAVVLNSGSGDVTIGGNLTATGDVLIFSGADIRSLDMTSLTGSISLTATDSVLGLSEPEAMPVGAGGNRVDSVTAGGQLSIVANQSDVRARTLSSATGNVDLTVAGSLTGLATSDPGNVIAGPTLTTNAPGAGVTIQAANIVRLKDVQSAGPVSINQSGTGGVAIASIVATGSDVSVAAGASGFFLGTVNTGAASGVVSLTSGLVTAPLAAPPYVAAPATLIDAGFGRTTVSAASSALIGGASGLLRQLGDVAAGSGAISISGQSISAGALTANNAIGGTIGVTANGGGLYLDSASAGVGLTLNKIGGTAATTGLLGDEIRVAGALTSQNADVTVVSDTNVRLANVMAPNGNIILAAKTGTLNLTNAMAGYSVALQSGTDMVVLDITANEDLGLQSGGTLSANNLSAGDDVVATVVGTATIAGINPAGNAVSPTNVDLRHIVFGGTSPLIIAGEDVQLGRRNAVIDSGGDLAITAANAADSMALRSGGVLTLGTALAGEDFAARATGNATLSSVTAGDDLDIVSTGGNVSLILGTSLASGDDTRRIDFSGAGIILANVETLAGGNVITDAAAVLTLGDVRAAGAPNAGSIIGRAGAAITGTFLSASADVSLQGAGNVSVTKTLAGDDIELTSTGGNVRLDEGSAANGTNDSTRADFSSSVLGIVAVEDHGGHNIFVDALNNVSLGTGSTTIAAQASIAARASTGSVTGSILTAGEDIATQSGGATMLGMVQAGDDIDVTSVGAVDLTIATTTGAGDDLRRADFSNASRIGLGAETLGRSNVAVVTDGNATLGTLSAAASIGILAKGAASAINSTSLTASEDVALKSTLGTVAALISAGDDVSAAAGTLADFDSVTARGGGSDDRDVIFGTGIGFSAAADAGGSDISVSGLSADIVFASANRDLSVSTSADTLSLTDGVAGRLATLAKTGASGDLRISGNLNAGSSITIGSTTDVLLASGKTVASTAGSIGLTATKSVFGLAGLSMAPAISEIGTLTTTGNITVTGIGDVRAVRLAAGGALDLNIGGSLTGTGVGAAVSPVVGGNLSAAAAGQSVTVMAGNGVGSVAYLDTIIAGGDVSLSASSIAFNGATAGGALNLAAGNGLNFVAANAGSANLFISGTPLPLPPLFAASDTLDARFGAADLSAGSTLTVTVASGLAQIGSANAGGNIGINGIALSVNNATSANAALAMTATGGALYLGDGSAGLGVSLTKSSGTDSNDELRVRRTVSGATGVVISSDTNARLGSVSSSAGNVSVQSGAITSGLGGGRAILSANGTGKSVSVNAGTVALLDTVTAGKDVGLTVTDTVDVVSVTTTTGSVLATAGSVLAGTVTSGGSLGLTASSGQLTLGTGTAGTTATLTKTGAAGELQVTTGLMSGGDATINGSTNVRVATVIASGGSASVSSALATTGIGSGRSNLSAIGAGKSVSVNAGSFAFIDTVTAGKDVNLTITDTVDAINATAIGGNVLATAQSVLVGTVNAGGALGLTANGGQLTLGTGTAGAAATLTKVGAAGELQVTMGLASGGDVSIDSATSARLASISSSAGNVNVRSLAATTGLAGGRAILSATGVGRSLSVNAGSTALLDTATAGKDISLSATDAVDVTSAAAATGNLFATAGSVLAGTVSTGGSIGLTATNGQLTLGTGTAGTTATLTKNGVTGELQVTNALTSGGDATIVSGASARLATISATAGAVSIISAQATTGLAGTTTGTSDAGFGRADLSAGAGKSITVTSGSLAQLGAIGAGQNILVVSGNPGRNGAVDVATAIATAGSLTLAARAVGPADTVNDGDVLLGAGSAGTSALLTNTENAGAAGNILVVSALTAGTSATVSSAASVTGGTIDANGGDTIITAAPLVELQVAEASGRVSATAGSVLIGRATSGGALMLTASSGQLTLGTGTAGTSATLAKTEATGELQVTTGLTSGADATINSSTNARLASVSATGGSVAVSSAQATTGVSGGRANLAANAAGKSVSVSAGTLALTGAVTAGKDVSLTASNLVDAASTVSASGNVQATAASVLAGTVSSGGAFALTANSGQLTLGTGSAGTSATLVKSGNVGDLQVSNSLVANGKVAIDSATNAGLRTIQSVADNIDVNSAQIALTGAVSVSADKTVTLANRKDISGNKTVLGDAAANASDFVLTDTELDLIAAPNLVISSDIKNVAVGALSLKAATGAKTLKLLSTNASNISLSGVISEEAAANRTLQIGGTQTASPALTPAIASENELAATIFATATADAGGRILLPNANVELRATKVIFGLGGGGTPGGLIEQAANLSSEEVSSQLVSRPDSVLYNPIPGYTQSDAGRTILSATTLTIRYTKFALFQNTAPAGLTGGVVLQRPGALAGPSGQPRLVLFSTSETPKNSVGLFGIIDGVTGNAAALLTTEIDTGNGTRITRSSSRLNGCAIGSPEQGCLTTQSPPPQLRLFDERQALVFRTADDSVLPFDPLVSTNNESLFIDFGGVSLPYDDAECAAGATSGPCPQPGDKK